MLKIRLFGHGRRNFNFTLIDRRKESTSKMNLEQSKRSAEEIVSIVKSMIQLGFFLNLELEQNTIDNNIVEM